MLLRDALNPNWIKPLEVVTSSYNNTPIERLGWLKPNDVTSPASSVQVDRAKKQNQIPISKEPTFDQMRENVMNYSGKIKVNDYVYKDFDSKLFDKSFDVSVMKQK